MEKYLSSNNIIMYILIAFIFNSCKQNTDDKINEIPKTIVKENSKESQIKLKNILEETSNEVNEMTRRVKFTNDNNSTEINGEIIGYKYVDYLITVSEGQNINISMSTNKGANYFNIMEPGEKYVAIYNASINGNIYKGIAAKKGDYTIRVYMMRSAARRGETANYILKIKVD